LKEESNNPASPGRLAEFGRAGAPVHGPTVPHLSTSGRFLLFFFFDGPATMLPIPAYGQYTRGYSFCGCSELALNILRQAHSDNPYFGESPCESVTPFFAPHSKTWLKRPSNRVRGSRKATLQQPSDLLLASSLRTVRGALAQFPRYRLKLPRPTGVAVMGATKFAGTFPHSDTNQEKRTAPAHHCAPAQQGGGEVTRFPPSRSSPWPVRPVGALPSLASNVGLGWRVE